MARPKVDAATASEVERFVAALTIAERVVGKRFEEILKIANSNGYKFTEEQAFTVLREMYDKNKPMPEWLKNRLHDTQMSAGWKD